MAYSRTFPGIPDARCTNAGQRRYNLVQGTVRRYRVSGATIVAWRLLPQTWKGGIPRRQ